MSKRALPIAIGLAGCFGAAKHVDWLAPGGGGGGKGELRSHLVAPVDYSGLLFDDDACARRFAEPAKLADDQLDAFAGCIAPLGFRAVEDRKARTPDARLVEYGPGLEVEVAIDPKTDRVRAIGFAGHAIGDARPMLGDHGLGALRVSGSDDAPVEAWVRVCIDEHGAIASARAVEIAHESDIALADHDFSLWKLRPFVFVGRARPACALVDLQPADGAKLPRALPGDVVFVHRIERVGGESSESEFKAAGADPLRVRVLACIDDNGVVTSAQLEAGSGIAARDAEALARVRGWHYRPLASRAPACTVDTVFFPR